MNWFGAFLSIFCLRDPCFVGLMTGKVASCLHTSSHLHTSSQKGWENDVRDSRCLRFPAHFFGSERAFLLGRGFVSSLAFCCKGPARHVLHPSVTYLAVPGDFIGHMNDSSITAFSLSFFRRYRHPFHWQTLARNVTGAHVSGRIIVTHNHGLMHTTQLS